MEQCLSHPPFLHSSLELTVEEFYIFKENILKACIRNIKDSLFGRKFKRKENIHAYDLRKQIKLIYFKVKKNIDKTLKKYIDVAFIRE